MIPSCIIALFTFCNPATILFRIWAIIVDAIQRMLWGRAWPHVGVELSKRLTPCGTNGNPPSPVMFKVFPGRHIASLFHVGPDTVFGKAPHAMSASPGHTEIFHQASTTASVTSSQAMGFGNESGSAFTPTQPVCSFFSFGSPRKNSQASIGMAGKINETHNAPPLGVLMVRGNPVRIRRFGYGHDSYPSRLSLVSNMAHKNKV
jgi:hypothetical protein